MNGIAKPMMAPIDAAVIACAEAVLIPSVANVVSPLRVCHDGGAGEVVTGNLVGRS
ncbi:MAG: hypothetical protein IPP40_07935 [bacterium]|nr:hypothetical protein [bacterium]